MKIGEKINIENNFCFRNKIFFLSNWLELSDWTNINEIRAKFGRRLAASIEEFHDMKFKDKYNFNIKFSSFKIVQITNETLQNLFISIFLKN